MRTLSKPFVLSRVTFCWRLLLAIVSGFIMTSLFSVWLPQMLHMVFDVQLTPSFIWALLSGFAIYCCLIMWLVASQNLKRDSVIVGVLIVFFWATILPVGASA